MKKLFILALTSVFGLSAFSQETGIKQYGFWDNWFVQVQGGASYTLSEYYQDAHFFKMITPHAALSAGKFFSPQTGARLQIDGWESKNYLGSYGRYFHRNYVQVSLDGMLNLTNVFLSYKENRPFNFYGILGAGYVYGFKKDKYGISGDDYIVPRAGLQADFRLSDVTSLNFEVMGNLLPDDFNGNVYGRKYDVIVNAMLGLTFHLPQRGFKVIEASDPAELRRLNDKLNERQSQIQSQQSEIDQYKKIIADLQNKKPETKIVNTSTQETVLNAVVVFRLGSAALEQNQEINIYNAAKYLKENPGVKVTVTGYADKSTGNATINQKLSEKRAKAVADILTSKYGISPSRITTEASGDKVQPFEINEWNRVVIFTADK